MARPSAKPAGATVTFLDLSGNPLLDAAGNPYPPVPLIPDGTFSAESLPVGIDFIIAVDLDGDGEADLTHIVSIPKDEEGDTGSAEDVDVNPLTTMAVAKLTTVLEDKGVSGDDLDFSPAAVIDQMTTAFETLFEAVGIQSTITADQIMSKTVDAMAEAFDELVPDTVKTTMDIVTSKVDAAEAETPEELVLAVIPALLRAGIAIADEPGGVVLDSVADLPNVEVVTWEDLFGGHEGPPGPGDPASKSAPARTLPEEGNRIFRSTVIEVDRNFAALEEDGKPPMQLIIRKHALERMAGLAAQEKTLSIEDLHRLVTDVSVGIGMRLTYWVPTPPPDPGKPFDHTPPPMMFQSADQRGVPIDTMQLDQQIFDIMGQPTFDPSQLASQAAAVREILKDALAGTQAPSIEQLFGGILSDDPVTFDDLSARIRDARSHLPWNSSGDASLFLLADRDQFRDDDARPVTVNVAFDEAGQLARVIYDPKGEGEYYVRMFGDPEYGFTAELVVVATGRMVHDEMGWPVWGDPSDAGVFAPVAHPVTGKEVSFLDAFSETGEFWPIEPALRLPNVWFNPELPPDPETNPPDITMHVLVDQPGPDGQPVTVSLRQDGAVVRDASGAYALDMFWEDPPVDGWMAWLVDARTGQRLWRDDAKPSQEEVRVRLQDIIDLDVAPQQFRHIYDIEVPNPMYDPERDPWYDDINGNGTCDPDEPTFSWREELWQAGDWRSTNVERYYRRADNNGFVRERDVNWESPTPKTWTGVALVPRDYRRRDNAFTFGRPNSATNLLSAFLSQDFFDGTHKLNGETRVGVFGALAVINLVFDARLYNLEAYVVDYGPEGARPAKLQTVEAMPWTPPIDDPVILLIEGFESLAAAPSQ